MNHIPDNFVFMKVGMHARETLEVILDRKQKEFEQSGSIFWGYGGSTCHPIKRVQPFVRSRILEGIDEVFLLMEPIMSLADPQLAPAKEFSSDGIVWKPIPKGIRVTGSKYALVLDEIMPATLTFDPREYVVAEGASAGKFATDYLRGRSDKGVFSRAPKAFAGPAGKMHGIGLIAKMQNPFAVLVRS
jgi:hypothetical protein